MYKLRSGEGSRFAHLVEAVANLDPELRVRFVSPHPKDFGQDLVELIATFPNVCNRLHLPVQSGSTTCLHRMRRGYTRDAYFNLIDNIRNIIPGAYEIYTTQTCYCFIETREKGEKKKREVIKAGESPNIPAKKEE